MECVYLDDSYQPCGAPATVYRRTYLCDEHIEWNRQFQYRLARSAALQSVNYHDLDEFPGLCYIVLMPDATVKIGYSNTEETLDRRLKKLGSSKSPVVKLAVIKGGFVAEAVLHEKFNDSRIPGKGERFRYSPEMAEYIASLV